MDNLRILIFCCRALLFLWTGSNPRQSECIVYLGLPHVQHVFLWSCIQLISTTSTNVILLYMNPDSQLPSRRGAKTIHHKIEIKKGSLIKAARIILNKSTTHKDRHTDKRTPTLLKTKVILQQCCLNVYAR